MTTISIDRLREILVESNIGDFYIQDMRLMADNEIGIYDMEDEFIVLAELINAELAPPAETEAVVTPLAQFTLDGRPVFRDSILIWEPAGSIPQAVIADSMQGGPIKNHYDFLFSVAKREGRKIKDHLAYSWPKEGK